MNVIADTFTISCREELRKHHPLKRNPVVMGVGDIFVDLLT